MDKPTWIDRIQRDPQANQSMLEYIDANESALLNQMHDAICASKMEESRVFAGEAMAWKKLRHQLKMYEREEEQHGIIQEQRG